MPSGKRENFTIRLKLDRLQRKALDGFLERARKVVIWAYQEQKSNLEVGVPLTLEELASNAWYASQELCPETCEHACAIGLEKLRAVLGGEISDRKKRSASLFAVGGSKVVFSVFEQVVGVPHLGACGFKRNRFILERIEGTDAKQLSMDTYRTELGYLNNEPCVVVDTVDRTPKRVELTEQKLVRVVRGPDGRVSRSGDDRAPGPPPSRPRRTGGR